MAMFSRRSILRTAALAGGMAAAHSVVGGAALGIRNALAADSDTLGFRSANDLATLIREKHMSSVELTRYFIERIEKFDSDLNAVVVRDFDRALDAAERADKALMKGNPLGPLHGLPMTIKESFNIEGLPTTWGIPAFADNIAQNDASVVRLFKAAGAHFMGKTNVPRGLGDFQSYNDLYGVTRNPWDPERTPGGSSGGTAAALAAGMTGLDCGSDFGGSIRNPAHFCGVFGHKSTWQVVSRDGRGLSGQRAAPDMEVVGPMARSAEDLALSMKLVAGPGELDAPAWRLQLPEPRARRLRDYRVAVWMTDDFSPPSEAITNAIQRVADSLTRSGARVSDSARPTIDSKESHYTYITLMESHLSAHRSIEQYEAAREYATSFADDDMSENAVWARAAVLDHRDWVRYHDERTRIRGQWKAFFQDWDIVLAPIMVTTAFPHDHSEIYSRRLNVDGKDVDYWGQLFWAGLATLPFLPSTVFPVGLAEDGLPVGLQAIGAEYNDKTTIEFARLLSQEIGGFQGPPGFGD